MLEVLRVMAGFESSWNWNAGRDITNRSSNQPCTEEAEIIPVSGNSMSFDVSLKNMQATQGDTDCTRFLVPPQRPTTRSRLSIAHACCDLRRTTTGP